MSLEYVEEKILFLVVKLNEVVGYKQSDFKL